MKQKHKDVVNTKRSIFLCVLTFVFFVPFVGHPVFVPFVAVAAGGQTSLADYSAPDRMARIAAAAKNEGALTLYTTIAEKDLPTLIRPFEAKYGIKVTVWRAGTANVLQRAVAEASAKRYDVDVIHVGSPEMEALAREQILLPVTSPQHKDLQPGSVPSHREWAATLLSVWVQAYNTRLVQKEGLPKTYRDLLDAKWKGKLGIEGKDEDWFASVVEVMGGGETGLKFFRDLMTGNGLSVRQGHTLLNNMVISGEVPVALNIYNYMPEQARKKGAPVDWFALEPAIARSNGVGVARHARHPNAALLLYEYLLGEGQQYFASMDYVPSNTKVSSPLKGIKILQANPARSLDEAEKWRALFENTVIKGARR
jgi:iron(III) transport system substrate-binding protein